MVLPTGLLPTLGILIGVITDISVFYEGKMSVVLNLQFQLVYHLFKGNINCFVGLFDGPLREL